MLCTCMSAKAKEAKSHLLDISDEQEEDPLRGVSDFNKIAVMGSSGVGKTSMCWKFAYGKNSLKDKIPDGAFIGKRVERVDDQLSVLQIQDVPAQFPVKHSPNNFHAAVQGADGFVLVYSVVDRRSLLVVEQIISYLHHIRKARDLPIVLVGNKSDIASGRRVRMEEGGQLAFEMGVSFYESSSHLEENQVTKVFHDLVRQIRCVRLRKEFERDQKSSSLGIGFCGARGLIDRISLRSKNRRNIMKR